jgi:hypothetical protein
VISPRFCSTLIRTTRQMAIRMSGPSSPRLERSPATGRLAFRYFVENATFSGANSDYIGIDRAVYNGPCGSPTPTTTATATATATPTATATATRNCYSHSYCYTDGYFYSHSDPDSDG